MAQARAGDPALLNLFREAGEVLGDAAGILIQTLEPDHIVICGPGTRAMDLPAPVLRGGAWNPRRYRNCASLGDNPRGGISMDILTDGVVMQALRELDLDLARLKAA